MSIKKILLATRPLTPPWDEASKNFSYFLAKSIKDPELQINILTTPTKLDGLGDTVVAHLIFPLYDASRAGHSFSQKVTLSKYLFTKSCQYDIVHYLFTPTALNSALIKNLTYRRPKTIQTIATLREDLYGPEDWKKMLFADRIVTYSDYSKHKLEEVGFENVTKIYPGIDLNLYSPQPKDEATMKHFNITPDDFVLSYFGEYARLGATDMLVEMLVKQLKNNSEKNIRFIFACRVKNDADQKKKDEVVEKLTQAGIIDRVRFSDTFKDMPKLYNLTDIVLFPVENMRGKFDIPLVIIEAYACGKPVIVTDLPIFKEFVSESIATIVPAGNSGDLWNAIKGLISDEGKLKAQGKSARAFVEQYFDLRNTAREYEKLYQSL